MNPQEAIMGAYRQGIREGYDRASKEIITELKDIIVDYNYSSEKERGRYMRLLFLVAGILLLAICLLDKGGRL